MMKTKNVKRIELSEAMFDVICERILAENCKAIKKIAEDIKSAYDNYDSNAFNCFYANNVEDDSRVGSISRRYGYDMRYGDDESAYSVCLKNGYYIDSESCSPDKYKDLYRLHKDGADIFDSENLVSYFKKSSLKTFLGYVVSSVDIKTNLLSEEIDLDSDDCVAKSIRNYLDNCDYIRARIQPYNSRWYLNDESQGHWDLWTESSKETDNQIEEKNQTVLVTFKEGVIARNPVCDVKHNAVVGIDFGTKSTVVAVQNDNDEISLMRVGLADYSKAAEPLHYENPTVMEFIDLENFYGHYSKKQGRPFTAWDDLKISHEAFKHMISSSKSTDLGNYFFDLKQWAGGAYNFGNGDSLIIKDKAGQRYDIRSFLDLTAEDINPIELYAYYLGLFINNMHTGIYLDYVLSFPETYSLEVKKAILNSFEKGIKKSIPETVFQDEECCNEFRVRLGSSEPAAYAVCALDSFGIEPTDKGINYAVFDFGGGTTDFDYGIWKQADEDNYYYDKILKHFGSGGDKTLGGENILQLMAYHIFTDERNIDDLRDNKIVFVKPCGGRNLPGMESLIKSDESAILNTKQLMEVIRPIWEENSQYIDGIITGSSFSLEYNGNEECCLDFDGTDMTAKVLLFDETGNKKVSVILQVDYEMLENVIISRIRQGISSFFDGMKNAFKKIDDAVVNIFLAGNSSKSYRVRYLFKDYILHLEDNVPEVQYSEDDDEKSSIILNIFKDSLENDEYEQDPTGTNQFVTSHFKLYPPLGTQEAICIQKENGIDMGDEAIIYPTGKTGVAYGLIMCREGGGIKIESETQKSEQIKTTYYIGLNHRKCFKLIFDRTNEYNVWKKYNKALVEMETFEFYYTQSSDVLQKNDIEIKNNPTIFKKKCLVNKSDDDAYIFFRFTSPSQLEYVIASEKGIESEQYISNIYKVNLE